MTSIDFQQVLTDANIPTTEDAALARFKEIITDDQYAPYNNQSSYSPFYRLVSYLFVKPVIWLTGVLHKEILPAYFLKTAKGKWVDTYAWALGLERKAATKAQGIITLSRYEANHSLTVAKDTVIQSAVIANQVYRLRVKENSTFAEGQTTLDVLCEAEQTGSAFNLATGFYSLISTELAGIANVENREDWLLVPGADKETDDELKERCRNQFMAVNGWQIDAVYKAIITQYAAISIDDIYIEHDAPRGAGTANLYILFEGEEPTQTYLNSITERIYTEKTHGLGDDVKALAIPRQQQTISAQIKVADWLETTQKNEIQQQIIAYISVALRALPVSVGYKPTRIKPFELFSWSNLISELHDYFPNLVSIDFANDTDIEPELWIPEITELTVEVV